MAIVNASYLSDNLKGLVGARIDSITAVAREARGKRPVSAVTKIVDVLTTDYAYDLIEEVMAEAAHFDGDVWVSEIGLKKVASRYLVIIILCE